MITFKQYLYEIISGKNKLEWKLDSASNKGGTKTFSFPGFKMVIVAQRSVNGSMFVDIAFSDDKGSVRPAGGKDPKHAIQVFNTLADILDQHVMPIIKQSGDTIVFSSTTPKTAFIYKQFAKTIAKAIVGVVKAKDPMQPDKFEIVKK